MISVTLSFVWVDKKHISDTRLLWFGAFLSFFGFKNAHFLRLCTFGLHFAIVELNGIAILLFSKRREITGMLI